MIKPFVFVLMCLAFNIMTLNKRDDEDNAPAENTDTKPKKAPKAATTKKSKSKSAVNIDVGELEGQWETTFYYNHTSSKVVARKCSSQEKIKWTISGSQWNQNVDNTVENKDLEFNSNGRWTIKEVVKTDSINFVKTELMKDSTESIEPCFAYMRDNDKLYTMINFTNPETCPQKFIFFDGVCSNTIDYTVSQCVGGKCAKKEEQAESKGMSISDISNYAKFITYTIGISAIIQLIL